MPYRLSKPDIADYYRLGYIVFRGILPPSLVADLRRACDAAAHLARRDKGPQAQRMQPMQQFEGGVDLKPFRDYAELPELNEALRTLLSPAHFHGRLDVLGVLLEPQQKPWCTAWHRDITLKSSRLPAEEFHDLMLDWNTVNQVNCPLYDDDCTWYVPGSHLRMRDLPGEVAAVRREGPAVIHEDAGETAIERANIEYVRRMPGAVQFKLHPGDFALYRPIGWHIGNYVPYKKRATLHDAVFTPQYETWWKAWRAGGSPRWVREACAAT